MSAAAGAVGRCYAIAKLEVELSDGQTAAEWAGLRAALQGRRVVVKELQITWKGGEVGPAEVVAALPRADAVEVLRVNMTAVGWRRHGARMREEMVRCCPALADLVLFVLDKQPAGQHGVFGEFVETLPHLRALRYSLCIRLKWHDGDAAADAGSAAAICL